MKSGAGSVSWQPVTGRRVQQCRGHQLCAASIRPSRPIRKDIRRGSSKHAHSYDFLGSTFGRSQEKASSAEQDRFSARSAASPALDSWGGGQPPIPPNSKAVGEDDDDSSENNSAQDIDSILAKVYWD